MDSQSLILAQIAIFAIFIFAVMAAKKKSAGPTVLNLNSIVNKDTNKTAHLEKSNYIKPNRKSNYHDLAVDVVRQEKNLNVIFMWNGHSWDAFEVFGLPAGSSLTQVKEKYQEMVSKTDSGQKEFLDAALKTIENKRT